MLEQVRVLISREEDALGAFEVFSGLGHMGCVAPIFALSWLLKATILRSHEFQHHFVKLVNFTAYRLLEKLTVASLVEPKFLRPVFDLVRPNLGLFLATILVRQSVIIRNGRCRLYEAPRV